MTMGHGMVLGWTAAITGVSVAAALVAHGVGARRFKHQVKRLIERLEQGGQATSLAVDPETLPPLVRAFAQRSGSSGPPPVRIWLRQRCAMRFKPGDAWRPLAAEQVITVGKPGFVWRATAQMAPLISARVVDAYVDGDGLLEARLFGSLPVARASGPEADRGELMRYLAELPWAPPAMVHNPSLQWRQLDDEVVEVAAPCAGGTARVRLLFADGEVVGCEADERPYTAGKVTVGRPWQGRFWDYEERGGYRIPLHGEVSWVLDDGPFTYWRGEIVDFAVEPSSPGAAQG